MKATQLHKTIIENLFRMLSKDRSKVYYLFYYSLLETLLLLAIPFASSFIINTLLAHASLSLLVLGLVVTLLLFAVVIMQAIKEYIIEKFQQTIFVTNAIEVGELAVDRCSKRDIPDKQTSGKYMNYFFEVLTLQKIAPMIVLDGGAIAMKVVVTLILLLAFDLWLFVGGVIFFAAYVVIFILLGKSGFSKAVERSDAKHESIYYLQHLCDQQHADKGVLEKLDDHLDHFVKKRQSMFKVIFRQLTWSYLMEALLVSGFLILGGLLVINGTLPVGEFVAAEILVISLVYAIHSFVKQLDYIYDMVESIYKIDKLSHALEEQDHAH